MLMMLRTGHTTQQPFLESLPGSLHFFTELPRVQEEVVVPIDPGLSSAYSHSMDPSTAGCQLSSGL